MQTICACIICQDEENMIQYSLHNPLKICDKVIIIDGGSKDKTIENIWVKADELNMRNKIELHVNPFKTLNEQRNLYLKHCTTDYIMYVDADEIITEQDLLKIKNEYIEQYDLILVRSHHFYIDFWHIASGGGWKNSFKMPRIFRNVGGLHYTDFTKNEGDHTLYCGKIYFMAYFKDSIKLCEKDDIVIWHYGHCQGKDKEKKKAEFFARYDYPELTEEQIKARIENASYFDKRFWEEGMNPDPIGIKKFMGKHPGIMEKHPLYNVRIIKD